MSNNVCADLPASKAVLSHQIPRFHTSGTSSYKRTRRLRPCSDVPQMKMKEMKTVRTSLPLDGNLERWTHVSSIRMTHTIRTAILQGSTTQSRLLGRHRALYSKISSLLSFPHINQLATREGVILCPDCYTIAVVSIVKD